MYKSGHFGLSLTLYAPFLYFFLQANEYLVALLGLLIVTACSSLPDLDLKISFIKHRGYSHTIIGALFIGLIIGVATFISYIYIINIISTFGLEMQYTAPMFAGMGFIFGFYGSLTHYAGDIVTPMGLKPFAPFSRKKYTLDLFYAKNKLANGGSLFLGFLITALVFGYHIYTQVSI